MGVDLDFLSRVEQAEQQYELLVSEEMDTKDMKHVQGNLSIKWDQVIAPDSEVELAEESDEEDEGDLRDADYSGSGKKKKPQRKKRRTMMGESPNLLVDIHNVFFFLLNLCFK